MKAPLKLNSIDQEHLQELYNSAGVARDELPYSPAFATDTPERAGSARTRSHLPPDAHVPLACSGSAHAARCARAGQSDSPSMRIGVAGNARCPTAASLGGGSSSRSSAGCATPLVQSKRYRNAVGRPAASHAIQSSASPRHRATPHAAPGVAARL